jgi:hypothetical protein
MDDQNTNPAVEPEMTATEETSTEEAPEVASEETSTEEEAA